MIITILAVLALVIVLIVSLGIIYTSLQHTGGSGASFLAKLRLGLRAIETETGHLPTEVTKLNEGLTKIGEGLKAVDDSLVQSINAALKQEKYLFNDK
jgi:uncharacterized protein YoxC